MPSKAAMTMNERIWNASVPTIPGTYREPTISEACLIGVESWIRCRDKHLRNLLGSVRGRLPPRPEDEGSVKQPPVDDPTPPDSGGAQSSLAGIPLPSTLVAASSTSIDMSGAKTPVIPTRPRSRGPPLGNATVGESPQTPLPKRTRATVHQMDDLNMSATIAEVTEVCEEPQLDRKTLASSDHACSTWFLCRHGARMVPLQHLQENGVYDKLDLPQGIKPTTARPKRDSLSEATNRSSVDRRTSTVRHQSPPRCVNYWRWHCRWGWPWLSGIALKLSSRHPSSKRATYGSHPRWKLQWNLDGDGVCSRPCRV